MPETVVISVFCAVSVLASALALLALRAADPLKLRQIDADLQKTLLHLQDELQHVRDVELPRCVAQCEAILEKAELRFESAESKRKSIAAREQHRGGAYPGGNGPDPWMDESLTRAERKALLERAVRGG